MIFYEEKNYSHAINCLTNAIELNTANKNLNLHRAINYMAIGEFSEALEDLKKCEVTACTPFVYILRSQIYLSKQEVCQ